MSVITAQSETFLRKYLNNASPTGFEAPGQQLWLEYVKPYIHEWSIDNYGTVYGVINPGKDFRVVIEGHADEISWFVNYISDDGFINVIRNGGSDHLIAPSKRVNIHTPKGIVKGVDNPSWLAELIQDKTYAEGSKRFRERQPNVYRKLAREKSIEVSEVIKAFLTDIAKPMDGVFTAAFKVA